MTTSSIVFSTIDERFPAAGQDNDSQGFRDNFAKIKSALSTAQSEITYLNTNSIDRSKPDNDLQGSKLVNLTLVNFSIESDGSSVASAPAQTPISFPISQYKRYSVSFENTIFTIENWPSNSYGEIYIEIISSVGTRRVRFSAGSSSKILHLGQGFGNNDYVDLARQDGTGKNQRYLFKIASPDGGNNVFVSLVDVFKEQTA